MGLYTSNATNANSKFTLDDVLDTSSPDVQVGGFLVSKLITSSFLWMLSTGGLRIQGVLAVPGRAVSGSSWWCRRCFYRIAIFPTLLALMLSFPEISLGESPSSTGCAMVSR